MSKELRIALVAEGVTDHIAIDAALKAMLGARPYRLQSLPPEESDAFRTYGGGWAKVYRWCHDAAAEAGGRLGANTLVFGSFDMLLLHVDADVAEKSYQDFNQTPTATDVALPCNAPCPPASDTTQALLKVVLSWCNEPTVPDRMVVCIPSKATDAWLITALFPDDAIIAGIECMNDPAGWLERRPIAQRVRKRKRDYEAHAPALRNAWPQIAGANGLNEAQRFQNEVVTTVAAIDAGSTSP